LPWTAEDLPSNRSPEEILEHVVARGQKLALRRRFGAGLAALLGTVMIVPAGVLSIGNEPTTLAGASKPPASVVPQVAATDPDPADTAPSENTPVVVGATSSVPPRPTTSAPPTTSRRPRPTATAPPVTVGQPPAGPSLPACGPSHLEARAGSLRPIYQPGEAVALFGTLTNVSSQACTFLSYTTSFILDDDTDPATAPLVSDAQVVSNGGNQPLTAGEVLSIPNSWSTLRCDLGGCVPGTYTAVFSWSFDGGPASSKAISFTIAAPTTTTTASG